MLNVVFLVHMRFFFWDVPEWMIVGVISEGRSDLGGGELRISEQYLSLNLWMDPSKCLDKGGSPIFSWVSKKSRPIWTRLGRASSFLDTRNCPHIWTRLVGASIFLDTLNCPQVWTRQRRKSFLSPNWLLWLDKTGVETQN